MKPIQTKLKLYFPTRAEVVTQRIRKRWEEQEPEPTNVVKTKIPKIKNLLS